MSGSGMLLHTGGGSSQDGAPPPLPEPASNGGRGAFTLLYDLFEQRVFNFCHRLLGSADDAAQATQETFLAVLTGPDKRQGHDSNFRVYLFAAAHDACQELLAGGTGARANRLPSGEPDEVYVDPERASLLSSLQEGVRGANRTLAETEREVLALRELEYFSHAEIAEIMRADHDSVPGLIADARLRLRDELRASAPAGAVGPAATPDCRQALPLIVMAQDAQPIGAEAREWLTGHLRTCEACRARREAMEEAGISYRGWLRIVPPHWLREATVAQAAELAAVVPTQPVATPEDGPHAEADDEQSAGGEGSATVIDDAIDAAGEASGGATDLTIAVGPVGRDHHDRRRFALGAFSTLLLLLGVGAAMVIASTGGNSRPAATSEPAGGRDAATTGSVPTPIASPTGTRHRTRRAPLKRTTRSSGALPTGVVTTSSSRARRSPKPVRRSPVRGRAEGGVFIPPPPRPSPPARSTPSTPTSPPISPPTGGTPSGKACGSPAGAPGAC